MPPHTIPIGSEISAAKAAFARAQMRHRRDQGRSIIERHQNDVADDTMQALGTVKSAKPSQSMWLSLLRCGGRSQSAAAPKTMKGAAPLATPAARHRS